MNFLRSSTIAFLFFVFILQFALESCKGRNDVNNLFSSVFKSDSTFVDPLPDKYLDYNLLVVPANPLPGESFCIVASGGQPASNSNIVINGPLGNLVSKHSRSGNDFPGWRVDYFEGAKSGSYKATLVVNNKILDTLVFEISEIDRQAKKKNVVWENIRSWDSKMETLFSAWINALFKDCNEQTSWKALHEVTQNKDNNFLFNYLGLNEDASDNSDRVKMEPDCADNPFFLRAYFAWKLGLPFGYHVSDRGWLGKSPSTGQWVTNETNISKNNTVQSFNSFIRLVMNGVHSGTARTAFENENSDYYPVQLDRFSLRPGVVFADPYGHTFVVVGYVPQTKNGSGVLLAADAQPDKTIAIKRFWKGNFLFNTTEVIGEPGFKLFRPIVVENGKLTLLKNKDLTEESGYVPFSCQQKNMNSDAFYQSIEKIINPKPLDALMALESLIKALHEQLLVRVKSVSISEDFLKSNPGTIIPIPSGAKGIFQTGGLWEDYSTPNRDLRLLIAIDAVMGFPEKVAKQPEDYGYSIVTQSKDIKESLEKLLEKRLLELSISYIRSNGSEQVLTLKEITDRKEAFEMAYNPNDGVEIRWGAPEGSDEASTCKRRASSNQRAVMQSVRKWFIQRLHPPT